MAQSGPSTSNCSTWPSSVYPDYFTVAVSHYYDTSYTTFASSTNVAISSDKISSSSIKIPFDEIHDYAVDVSVVKPETVTMELEHQLDLSYLAFTTAKLDAGPRAELDIYTCPLRPKEVMKCQVNWCLKIFKGVEMVCTSPISES